MPSEDREHNQNDRKQDDERHAKKMKDLDDMIEAKKEEAREQQRIRDEAGEGDS